MKNGKEYPDQLDYDSDLRIDPDSLDVEWLNQPRTFFRYAKILADAGRVVDRAKENLDIVRAVIDKEVRSRPDKFGLEKVTEKAIESIMVELPEYQEASARLIDARYEEKMAKGAVEAFQQRKDALQELVRLHAASYFAGPKIPRDLSKEWEQRETEKMSNQAVSSRMRRTRT